LLILMIIFGIYQRVPSYKSIKAIFISGNKEIISNTYTITIIAVEPSLPYDYDNSSIRIDLVNKRDDLSYLHSFSSYETIDSIQFNANQIIDNTTKNKKSD
jgi:hypothetical protein